jgi:hypothetical protein
LESIELFDVQDPLARTWDDWSLEKERKREERHALWLRETLGHAGTFPWGTVSSGYDERRGSAVIVVRYRPE